MTNLNKTKEEIIFELVLSLNQGDSGYATGYGSSDSPRVNSAIIQYNALVKAGIIKEIEV